MGKVNRGLIVTVCLQRPCERPTIRGYIYEGTVFEYDHTAGDGFCVSCGTMVKENTVVHGIMVKLPMVLPLYRDRSLPREPVSFLLRIIPWSRPTHYS